MFVPKMANVKNGDIWHKIPFSEVKKYDEIQILDGYKIKLKRRTKLEK